VPNLAKLRQDGAYGRLASEKPLLSPIIWTTIATGKGPDQHGIGHFVAVDSETGEQRPVTSRMRRVQALWNIADGAGRDVLTVGWWATWPPEPVGQVVSDHTAYHFLFEDGFADGTGAEEDGTPKTHPPELWERIEPMLVRPDDLGPEDVARFVDVTPEELDRPFEFQDDLAHFKWALSTARSYRDVGLDLWKSEEPDLAMVYIEATDSTAHLFGHLFRAEGLGGELAEQQKKFGRAVEEMYLFADRLLGEVMAAMDERSTLVVVSDHGFELGVLHDDPSKTRDLRRVSERFHKIEGVIYLYGHQVKRHGRLDRPTIRDVAPTVLSLLGLPAGQDMPGRVLEEGLDRDAAALRVAKRRIASYEDGSAPAAGSSEGDSVVSGAQLEHLKSLGYLSGGQEASPQGDRNLAAILFEDGRYRESAQIYHQLIQNDPEDAALRTSLAGALGAMGRYDDALEQLVEAIRLEPLNVEAYHNRAVIQERRNDVPAAVADYERALRYQPQYEPSRRALYRLTGRTDVRAPRNEAEARAAQLAEQAAAAAKRANYQEAMRLLDEAVAAAPGYVITYQYRSNVAYLMGDRAGAIAALEEALKIEPDNALFQANIERLRSEN
jgi:tetratricopeptide (TPR) repeat protein